VPGSTFSCACQLAGSPNRREVPSNSKPASIARKKRDFMAQLDPHFDADLAVTLDEDRPGTLAKALGCVSGAGINIDGYAEIGGVVHVLSPDQRAAHACLEQSGFRIMQEHRVVVVSVADEPGTAARVFQRLAEAHINVKYSYLATRNRLVIAPDDPEAAIRVLTVVV
jgi:hypothetical protein